MVAATSTPAPAAGAPTPTKAKSAAASHAAARKKEARKAPHAAPGGTSVSMSKKADGGLDALGGAAGLSSGDLFARNLSVMSVAHVARGVGFDAVQKSAADALTEILAKYIQRIGGAAKDIAELAGRTQPKATDVVQALQDLEPAPVELKDLVKTLETAKRPFPRDVPAFPARKRDISGNAIEQTKIGRREGLPPHVPSFLPPLPNRHTYSSDSRLVVDREQDTKRTRLELLSEKAQVRQSLHGLQTAAAKKPAVIVHQPTWNAFQGSTGDNATENPFVQAPIVSPVAKGIFAGPDRDFVPNVDREKAQSKNQLDNNVTIPKLSNQEQGKEEKILSGTFHDGDSE
ncbi:Transcription initiation factor TFIID subunit 3 [Phytophthora cinnamomi]|uniref:Transcription initiation factor TFIID subunit 3 n=1 Tax=Phytophthora cinnamomi TaxID=4785 RepID=UPI003559ED2F|nr:Transcription initiation factor TFIID subunit 3 [Phytophthora cinnamomi]